jgi:hypothetical protein
MVDQPPDFSWRISGPDAMNVFGAAQDALQHADFTHHMGRNEKGLHTDAQGMIIERIFSSDFQLASLPFNRPGCRFWAKSVVVPTIFTACRGHLRNSKMQKKKNTCLSAF